MKMFNKGNLPSLRIDIGDLDVIFAEHLHPTLHNTNQVVRTKRMNEVVRMYNDAIVPLWLIVEDIIEGIKYE